MEPTWRGKSGWRISRPRLIIRAGSETHSRIITCAASQLFSRLGSQHLLHVNIPGPDGYALIVSHCVSRCPVSPKLRHGVLWRWPTVGACLTPLVGRRYRCCEAPRASCSKQHPNVSLDCCRTFRLKKVSRNAVVLLDQSLQYDPPKILRRPVIQWRQTIEWRESRLRCPL